MKNMTEQKKSINTIIILLGAIAIIFVAVYSLYDAFIIFQSGGDTNQANFSLIIGFITLILSFSVITRLRRGLSLSKKSEKKVVTRIECMKCGLKEIRKFNKGDYVLKLIENCNKCAEPKLITAIYAEEKEN